MKNTEILHSIVELNYLDILDLVFKSTPSLTICQLKIQLFSGTNFIQISVLDVQFHYKPTLYVLYCAQQQQTLYGPRTCHVGFEVCRKYNKYTRKMNIETFIHLFHICRSTYLYSITWWKSWL